MFTSSRRDTDKVIEKTGFFQYRHRSHQAKKVIRKAHVLCIYICNEDIKTSKYDGSLKIINSLPHTKKWNLNQNFFSYIYAKNFGRHNDTMTNQQDGFTDGLHGNG